MIALAVSVLLALCVHEFAWQLWPPELQGDVRAVTQWALISSLAMAWAASVQDRFVRAVCACAFVMSSTTALCSAYWLATRFTTVLGQEQCSKAWGMPMLVISAVAALAVFWRWPCSQTTQTR